MTPHASISAYLRGLAAACAETANNPALLGVLLGVLRIALPTLLALAEEWPAPRIILDAYITGSAASDKNPPEHLYGLKVTQNMLPLLGIEPLLGRLFVAGEDQVGASALKDVQSRPGEEPDAVYRIVMPGYFQAMRLPVLGGRAISDSDDSRSPAVVMLNEQAAHVCWPGESAIGKRISLDTKAGGQLGPSGSATPNRPAWLTVIGIVANAKLDDLVSNPYPEMYLPALQTPDFSARNRSGCRPYELHHARGAH
jgi:hypothetical protein